MYISLLTSFRILLFLVISPVAVADYKDGTELTLFPIPEHGEIVFEVPQDWDYTYVAAGLTAKPPVITFFTEDESGREVFQLNVSILWDDGFARDILEEESIQQLVRDVGEDILPFSDETELQLERITGQEGLGYIFSLTDSSARPGEYRYLTQGALSVGEVLLVFSLFSNDREGQLRENTLEMIKTALHKIQRHVQNLLPQAKTRITSLKEVPA